MPRGTGSRTGLLLIGLGLIGLSLGWSDKTAFPYPWAIPAVLGTLLTIAAVASSSAVAASTERGAASSPWPQRLLEHPLALHIGKTSYSLYLWHWPIYVLMRWTLGLEPG